MFHIDNDSGVAVMPAISAQRSAAVRWFSEGGGNNVITWPGMDWFNIIQAELLNILSESGIQPDKTKLNQLSLAIKKIIGNNALLKANCLLEIKEAGASKQAQARQNLGLEGTVIQAAGALQKNQNGADIPNKDLFVKNVGAARAYSGGINIGGDSGVWTTAQFIAWLEGQRAFNHPYWMCKGSWSYANNKVITDTGCGNICLAGAVIEVMGIRNVMTIRVTTPSASSGSGVPNAEFIYTNHGDQYSPGWRRDFNTRNKPTAADTNALPITGGYLTGNVGFNNDSTLGWERYTDWAKIGFKNNSDGDTDAYMWFETGDNGNEYFKWRHKISGGTTANDWMTLKSDALRVAGSVVAGSRKGLAIGSANSSTLNAYLKLWGASDRPAVVELSDDKGWHLYSQRNTDNSVTFAVNGQVIPSHYGNFDARYVRDVRMGANQSGVVWGSGGGIVSAGYVLTGGNFDDDRSWPVYAPVQKYINGQWYNVGRA